MRVEESERKAYMLLKKDKGQKGRRADLIRRLYPFGRESEAVVYFFIYIC